MKRIVYTETLLTLPFWTLYKIYVDGRYFNTIYDPLQDKLFNDENIWLQWLEESQNHDLHVTSLVICQYFDETFDVFKSKKCSIITVAICYQIYLRAKSTGLLYLMHPLDKIMIEIQIDEDQVRYIDNETKKTYTVYITDVKKNVRQLYNYIESGYVAVQCIDGRCYLPANMKCSMEQCSKHMGYYCGNKACFN